MTLPLKRIHLAECSSTNMVAHEMLQNDEHIANTIISTDFQTAGKGLDSNTWHSEAGKNLLFSLIIEPKQLHPASQFRITKAVSLAIRQTLLDLMPYETITIKWPNDIYAGNNKLCGMLISNMISGNTLSKSIIGVGLNVNQTRFPDHLPNPVSIKHLAGMNTDRDWLLDKLLVNMAEKLTFSIENQNDNTIDTEYLNALYRREGCYGYQAGGNHFSARIVDVNLYGHLVLETTDGQRKSYELKEVAFI